MHLLLQPRQVCNPALLQPSREAALKRSCVVTLQLSVSGCGELTTGRLEVVGGHLVAKQE